MCHVGIYLVFCIVCLFAFTNAPPIDICVLVSVLSSGESEPGDRQCVSGGGRDGDYQLSGEGQRRLRYPAAQPQQTDNLLQRHET